MGKQLPSFECTGSICICSGVFAGCSQQPVGHHRSRINFCHDAALPPVMDTHWMLVISDRHYEHTPARVVSLIFSGTDSILFNYSFAEEQSLLSLEHIPNLITIREKEFTQWNPLKHIHLVPLWYSWWHTVFVFNFRNMHYIQTKILFVSECC